MILSKNLDKIKPSATLTINAKAKLLKSQGHKVYNLAAGEPDFPTPTAIREAGKKALEDNYTRYTAASGIPELKKAVAKKFSDENGIGCSAEEVTITNGGKQALYNTFLAITNPGDEIIIPLPYWVSYTAQIRLCGCLPVFVDTDSFTVTAELLKEKITPKTKAIIINSPSNPSGAVIPESELRKIAELALEHDLFIISDEVYEKIIYDEKHFSLASISEEVREKTITVNALSKTYSMTGLRLGYCTANKEIIRRMNKIQGQTTSNACSIVQKMALKALDVPEEEITSMVEEFRKRRDFVLSKLEEMGLPCHRPEGAFYVFPSIERTGMDSVEFCEKLLDSKRIAVIPGEAFGCPKNIRISYATSMMEIEAGLEKIQEFLRETR